MNFSNLKYRKNKVKTIGKALLKKKRLQNVNTKIGTRDLQRTAFGERL